MVDPIILGKFTSPGPIATTFIYEWQKYFKDSKYVGHGAAKTGSTAYAKFSIPMVHKTKLCRVSVNTRRRNLITASNMFSDLWSTWAKLRIEKNGLSNAGKAYNDWTNTYSRDNSFALLMSELGTNSHAHLYEAFFTAVGFMPEINKAINDILASPSIEDKKRSHAIKSALYDIREPLRTLLRYGIETEQLHDMINNEIVDLITNG